MCIYKGLLICWIFWFIWISPPSLHLWLWDCQLLYIYLQWVSLHLHAKKYFSTPRTSYLGLGLSGLSNSLWYRDWDIDIRKEPTWLNWSDIKLEWPFVSSRIAHTCEKNKMRPGKIRGPEEQSSDEIFKPLSQFVNEMKQKQAITTTGKNR